jgi:hypothetical protein
MNFSPMQLERHVRALASAFNVLIQFDPEMDAVMSDIVRYSNAKTNRVVASIIRCRPVEDDTTYAIAMHELGHACDPMGYAPDDVREENMSKSRRANLELDCERAAWRWARHYALTWNHSMDLVMYASLSHYKNLAEAARS